MTATTTPAQDEFNALVANNAAPTDKTHPEDRAADRSSDSDDADEEERYQQSRVDAAMRSKSGGGAASGLNLPPASFDNGRATGVKGVIADARSYEAARKSGKWRSRIDNARRSIFGMEAVAAPAAPARKRGGSGSSSSTGRSDDDDDDDFLRRWRESRKRELEEESGRPVVRNRRTSPSVREYGRLDEVDALGYLDAIEKVGRDTTVVVFVYDHECEVSSAIEQAMLPLVKRHRAAHFVKVHYDDIEFDPAATPSVLAYRNQGDLVGNLTGLIEMIPDDDAFGTDALYALFQQYGVLP